jgi:16S rRNA (cytosine967-C5)-methyltransferase
MTPAARVAAAIEVLETFVASDAPADRLLAAWGRAHRFAGSGDRAAIADRVYVCLRRWRSSSWRLRRDTPRAAAIGSLVDEGIDPAALFDGARHGPAPLSADERAALASPPEPAPDPVRLDYPDWLDDPLRDSLGPAFETALAALRNRAPVDMRTNLLRGDRDAALAALAAGGIDAWPTPHAPTALRAAPGAPVARARALRDGLIELQDAASQAAALLADARPGETVLDFCAGGGGKALALAAAMGGRGRVIAHDVAPGRMRDIPERARRAGARIETALTGDLVSLEGGCDLVFVDAPCSGSGAWRRDPGGKWRLTRERLDALMRLQSEVLQSAARYVRPGGADRLRDMLVACERECRDCRRIPAFAQPSGCCAHVMLDARRRHGRIFLRRG